VTGSRPVRCATKVKAAAITTSTARPAAVSRAGRRAADRARRVPRGLTGPPRHGERDAYLGDAHRRTR
jgi:hypothetical protein